MCSRCHRKCCCHRSVWPLGQYQDPVSAGPAWRCGQADHSMWGYVFRPALVRRSWRRASGCRGTCCRWSNCGGLDTPALSVKCPRSQRLDWGSNAPRPDSDGSPASRWARCHSAGRRGDLTGRHRWSHDLPTSHTIRRTRPAECSRRTSLVDGGLTLPILQPGHVTTELH